MSDVTFKDEDDIWQDEDATLSDHTENLILFTASSKGDSDTSDPSLRVLTGKYAHGEENPTAYETPVSWATWSNGAGGSPNISGDADWGKLSLLPGGIAHSPVYDTGGTHSKKVSLTKNLYGSGDSYFDLYIRGQNTAFTQDDVSPSWEAYVSATNKTWQYLQARVVGQ